MRLTRLAFVFAAVYFALIGGGVYYSQLFPVRVLHHAVVTVLLVVWLLRRVRRGLPATPLNLLLAALIGVWALSAVFSLDPRSAFENLWFPLTHVVLFLIIADLIGRGRESLLMETFFLVTAALALLALAQLIAWYTGIDLVPEAGVGWLNVGMIIPPETPMIFIPLGVSTWLAAFAAPTLIVALGWALSSPRYRLVFLGIAGALLLVLIGTFSRGGFLAFAAGISALIGLRALRSLLLDRSATLTAQRAQIVRLIPVFVLILVLVAASVGLIVLIGRSEARATGDDLRFGLWGGAASMIADDPLTGVGPGLFGRAYRDIRSPANVDDRLSTAHNAYLNNAAETGIPGVIVMIGFDVVIGWRWLTLWRRADKVVRRRRLEAALAALIAFGVQSFFDTFLYTPLVLISLVLIAYCTIEPGSLLTVPPSRSRRFAAAALALAFVGYGAAFIQFDRALAAFSRSVRAGDLAAAQEAVALDPHVNLYHLQVAYLIGQGDDLAAAQAAYEGGVALEPTWETGWINLAAIREQQGDIDGALAALLQANNLRYDGVASLHWARIADAHDAAPDDEIIAQYQAAMSLELPLSDFWIETERRRVALDRYVRTERFPLEWRYRVAALRDPDYAGTLIAAAPSTAGEWWVVGHAALDTDAVRAVEAFTQAIRLNPMVGDYYVSRARAELALDPAAARRDLNIADMLPTLHEYPNAVRVALAASPEEIRRWRAAAVPARVVDQNFEGVLFQGRVASFELFPSIRRPGIGTAGLQPWYDLAADYTANGQIDAARSVYRAILDVAPFEQPALEALESLS